jgi:drug/metabolite transporter (DMT)-like permease
VPASLLGTLAALASAICWGGGDFSGGYASRRSLPFQVSVAVSLISALVFLSSALATMERLPSITSGLWALIAGVAGVLGLGALYQGLAVGSAAIVSPTAAVLGASIPVIFGALFEGMPPAQRLAGICFGFIGIWLVSRTGNSGIHLRRRDLALAIFAGTCFAGFFICLGQIPQGSFFYPLTISKIASITTATTILLIQRKRILPTAEPALIMAGLLEAGGNWGFLLARQLTRLDIAVVISSMYPAITVILAWFVTHQYISRLQWAGLVLCLLAVGLIAI